MPDKREHVKRLPPIHPGEILNKEFLAPMGVTQYRLAKSIDVDPRRINSIVHGRRAITAETALLLARFFGNSAGFWLGIQNHYDLEIARDQLGETDESVHEIPVIDTERQAAYFKSGRRPATLNVHKRRSRRILFSYSLRSLRHRSRVGALKTYSPRIQMLARRRGSTLRQARPEAAKSR